jgi:radical SAM superfamily enzyme
MKSLNPIQILELQDLAKAELEKLHKSLDKRKYTALTFSKISNLQKAVITLDQMFDIAVKEEDLIEAN